jgi:hypothetical protein
VRAGSPQQVAPPGHPMAGRQVRTVDQLNPEQLEQFKKAMAAERARQAMQQGTSATNAFDVMRRRKALADAQARAAAEGEARRAAAAEAAAGAAGETASSAEPAAEESSEPTSGTRTGDGAPQPLASSQPLPSSQPLASSTQRSAPPAGRPGPDPRRPVPTAVPAVKFEGVGRNDTCPCGSGKKFKKCHGQA